MHLSFLTHNSCRPKALQDSLPNWISNMCIVTVSIMDIVMDIFRHAAGGMAGYLLGKLFCEVIENCGFKPHRERVIDAALQEPTATRLEPSPNLPVNGNPISTPRARPWTPPQAAPRPFSPERREYLLSMPQLQSGSRLDDPPRYSSLGQTRITIVWWWRNERTVSIHNTVISIELFNTTWLTLRKNLTIYILLLWSIASIDFLLFISVASLLIVSLSFVLTVKWYR